MLSTQAPHGVRSVQLRAVHSNSVLNDVAGFMVGLMVGRLIFSRGECYLRGEGSETGMGRSETP